jgi:4-alpha-glucanotransferase
LVVDENNQIINEEICTHHLNFVNNFSEYNIYDVWNNKNFPENYLNNKILQNKLGDFKPEKVSILKKHTHHFRIEAPLYSPDWRLVVLGIMKHSEIGITINQQKCLKLQLGFGKLLLI